MKNIRKLYERLFEDCNIEKGYRLNKKTVYFNELSHFVGMKGEKLYVEEIVKILKG